jgi:hypothetical protein
VAASTVDEMRQTIGSLAAGAGDDVRGIPARSIRPAADGSRSLTVDLPSLQDAQARARARIAGASSLHARPAVAAHVPLPETWTEAPNAALRRLDDAITGLYRRSGGADQVTLSVDDLEQLTRDLGDPRSLRTDGWFTSRPAMRAPQLEQQLASVFDGLGAKVDTLAELRASKTLSRARVDEAIAQALAAAEPDTAPAASALDIA